MAVSFSCKRVRLRFCSRMTCFQVLLGTATWIRGGILLLQGFSPPTPSTSHLRPTRTDNDHDTEIQSHLTSSYCLPLSGKNQIFICLLSPRIMDLFLADPWNASQTWKCIKWPSWSGFPPGRSHCQKDLVPSISLVHPKKYNYTSNLENYSADVRNLACWAGRANQHHGQVHADYFLYTIKE